ncbi:MAG: hypothetical protein Q9209_001933 [Squamulea sp. 1 TL-2023]
MSEQTPNTMENTNAITDIKQQLHRLDGLVKVLQARVSALENAPGKLTNRSFRFAGQESYSSKDWATSFAILINTIGPRAVQTLSPFYAAVYDEGSSRRPLLSITTKLDHSKRAGSVTEVQDVDVVTNDASDFEYIGKRLTPAIPPHVDTSKLVSARPTPDPTASIDIAEMPEIRPQTPKRNAFDIEAFNAAEVYPQEYNEQDYHKYYSEYLEDCLKLRRKSLRRGDIRLDFLNSIIKDLSEVFTLHGLLDGRETGSDDDATEEA